PPRGVRVPLGGARHTERLRRGVSRSSREDRYAIVAPTSRWQASGERAMAVGIVLDVQQADPVTPGTTPPSAVLFDFHGTLAQVEDPVVWVTAAASACGTRLGTAAATLLADRLVTAGRAGGPAPHRVPPHLAEVYADRDLYEHAHRAAYVGLAQ